MERDMLLKILNEIVLKLQGLEEDIVLIERQIKRLENQEWERIAWTLTHRK